MRSILLAVALVAFSVSGLHAESAGAVVEASAPDWTDQSGAFSLSYRSLDWDLMSRVRPEHVSSDYALQIISADKEFLWCDVQTMSFPLVGTMNQRSISEQTRTVSTQYVEGATIDDPLGGSHVASSRVLNAGDVVVRRVVLDTLDQRRPILRRDLIQFAVAAGREFKFVQIVCSVGFGSPPDRANEPSAVLDSLKIRGVLPR
jgi:hypothetical protein